MNRFIIAGRLTALVLGLAAPVAALSQAGSKPGYPEKTVRIIVPYPAGGAVDYVGRLLASRLPGRWGQPVVVENRPGSSTILASELVAKSPADGYTIFLAAEPTMTVNPHMFAKLPYDPLRDFAPVTQLVTVPLVLLAHPSVSANNIAELVALAKTQPGALNYGSYGNGSPPHLVFELLKSKAGMDIVHVPYKGATDVMPAMIAGQVQLTLVSVLTGLPQAKAGRAKILAYAGAKRSTLIPAVPTFAEQNHADVPADSWFGLFVPAGTPRQVISRIHRDAVQIFTEPGVRDREIIAKGYELVASSPEEFAAFLRWDMINRGRAVKASGARAE